MQQYTSPRSHDSLLIDIEGSSQTPSVQAKLMFLNQFRHTTSQSGCPTTPLPIFRLICAAAQSATLAYVFLSFVLKSLGDVNPPLILYLYPLPQPHSLLK